MSLLNARGTEVVTYPSTFFDLATSSMPDNLDELMEWCVYYYLATPLIPAVINKLSTYPITDTIIESKDSSNKEKWDGFLNQRLNVKYKMFENNLDYFLLGAAYTGIYIPFKRMLACTECGTVVPMNGAEWKAYFRKKNKNARNNLPEISLFCEICKKTVSANIQDNAIQDWGRVNIVRYSPKDIKPLRDPISGKSKYLWTVPQKYVQIIKSGRHPDLFEACPTEILEAINTDCKVLLSDKNVYEMKRPTISGQNEDRGTPLVIHALKWTYYLSQLQKAQEAIAHEKIIPFDVLFPASANGTSAAPSQTIGMAGFTNKLMENLEKHRKDPGHKAVMPVPVGTVRLGGDGRALMLAAEIDWVSKQIIASMGVPIEFVYGGLTWTGSSITLRMLENSMIGIRDNTGLWLQWVVDKIASAFNIDSPKVRMADLKMADDIQRQQILMNLEATERISRSSLLDEFDIDFQREGEKILGEADMKAKLMIAAALSNARASGTAAMVQNDFMMRSQLTQQAQSGAAGIDPATGYPTDQNGVPIDPNTGFPIDPAIGLPMNPQTGEYINPETGEEMKPDEAQQYVMAMNQQQGQQQNTANAPTEGNQGVPGGAVDNAIYSQQEQREDATATAAQQAGRYNLAPPNVKATVTNLAKSLLTADIFTRTSVLQNLRAKSPALESMVNERIAMLSQGVM